MGKIASKGCCAGARNEIAEALKRRLALRKKEKSAAMNFLVLLDT